MESTRTETRRSGLDDGAMSQELQVKEKQAASGGEQPTHEGRWFQPAVDIYETPDAIVVTADIPGAALDAIETDVRDNVLTLSARVEPVPSSFRPLHREYEVGHYTRQFRLGQQIDQTRISASLRDGVLTLTLPKADAAKPRRIEVKSS